MTITDELVEAAAKAIFEHYWFGSPVAWMPRGNSEKQHQARAFARAALEAVAPMIRAQAIAAERERCAVIAEMGAKMDGQTRDLEALMQELAVADYAADIAQAIRSGV